MDAADDRRLLSVWSDGRLGREGAFRATPRPDACSCSNWVSLGIGRRPHLSRPGQDCHVFQPAAPAPISALLGRTTRAMGQRPMKLKSERAFSKVVKRRTHKERAQP